MSGLGLLTLNLVADIGGFTKPMDQVDRRVAKSKRKIKKFSKESAGHLKNLAGSFVSLAGVGGVGALTAAIVTTGARFENQMATVRGVMRATDKDFKALSNAAKVAGETTEWSATQSATALNYMGMAGYNAQQSIAALPGVLNLATAGGIELGLATDIVTDSLTAMGLGVQDLGRFNDVLAGTITRSNTNIEMMGETLRYSAPIAKQYGVEIESLSAMIGVLANAGIKASDAGTDLRQAMVKNVNAAKELGTAENDLIGTLKAAKKAGWGVNDVTEKYGLIASKSVLVLMDQLEKYEELEEQLHDVKGETEKLAKTKLDTLMGDFKILKSTVEGLALSVSDDTNKSVRGAVQELTATIRENKDTIISLFTGIITAGTEAVSIVSQITRSVGFLGVVAASEDKSIWDWFLLDPEGAKQWQREIQDGTAFLKDELAKVRKEIATYEIADKNDFMGLSKLFGGDNSEQLVQLRQREKQILDAMARIKEAAKAAKVDQALAEYFAEIDGFSIPGAGPEGGGGKDKKDAEKLAAQQAAAWQAAYGSLDTMTRATYDKMMSYAKKEYEQNLKLLGDKETAQALYAQSVSEINNKMFGEGIDTALDSFFRDIDDAVENYNDLMAEGVQVTEDMQTPLEQISAEVAHFTEMLDVGAITAETYTRALSKIADEDLGLDSLFISDTDFDGQIAAENELYEQRLAMLEQYRQERSDLNAEWDEKEAELTQQHQNKISEIEQARQQLALSSASSMFGDMAEMIGAFAGESSGAYKAMFAVSKAFSVAEATINMFQAISEAGTLPYPENLAAMAIVAAQMSTIVSSVSAVGMAHDGIDSVPASGTWLLEKGERVTTAETSSKLDRTLSDVQRNMELQADARSYQISIPVSVSGGDSQFAATLSAEIETTVMNVMRREMR